MISRSILLHDSFQTLLGIFLLPIVLLSASKSLAADLTLLAGYQYNSDFEIAQSEGELATPLSVGEPGDDLALDGGAAIGLAMDFVFNGNPDQRIGFFVSHHQTQFESGAGLRDEDMDITHVHFTAMNYYPSGNWEPFVLAGIGAAFFSPGDSSLKDTTKFSAQIAGGANYKLSDNLLLRLEARWIPTFFNGSSAGICSGGCTIALKSEMYSQFQTNIGLQFRF
jgi:opacity protein-like surface antigen